MRLVARSCLVVLLALTLLCCMVAPAWAISRAQVVARAQTWVDHPIPYSQGATYSGYRTDCSGYVSMCWNTNGFSWSTATLHTVSYEISPSQLKPGDVMLWAGHHVRLFVAWVDAAHTSYVCYEQTSPQTKTSVKVLSTDIDAGYVPYRYQDISDSGLPPWNLYRNESFDLWSQGTPVWCTFATNVPGTSCSAATDVTRSSFFALRIVNSALVTPSIADVKQTVPVTAGCLYGLSAWARATAGAGAVQMHLQFLDGTGKAIPGGLGVDGIPAGVNSGTLRQLQLSAVAPAGATQAIVYLRLTGGAPVPGASVGSVVFDDVAMWVASPMAVYRFYNKRSATHFYTASPTERDAVGANLSSMYQYEGVCYAVDTLSGANDDPLYRFYNKKSGTHFYTASEAEKNVVVARLSGTYRLDGPAYNVCVTPATGATPVYRFYNKLNGTHFYTASEAEKANTIARFGNVYALDGVAFYLAP